MKYLKILLILFGVLLGITIAYFSPLIFRKTDKKAPPVIERLSERRVAVARGIVETTEKADISSKVTALIKKILADENEDVKRGQLLVIMDSRDVAAQLNEAEASVVKAEANYQRARSHYERYDRLYKHGAVALDELEDAKRWIKSAEGELLAANAHLDYVKILLQNYSLKSPIDGIVIKKHLEDGEMAKEGMPVISLANINTLEIKAELDETEVGKIHLGQSVEVLVDAYPGRIYKGKVKKISEDVKRKRVRTFDPSSWIDINSQEITIKLDSYEGLKIGMTVDVRFYEDKPVGR